MSSNERFIQSYLERYEISKLFEDMMAKLIKEMPKDPINYLIKFLQKINLKTNTSPEKTFPSSILYKPDMGLTGSSIPKKYSKDPQIVLPGSKLPTSTWVEKSTANEELLSDDNDANEHHITTRDYEKPWLPGSKQSKEIKEKKNSMKSKPTSWSTDTGTKAKSFEDVFDNPKGDEGRKNTHNKSATLEYQRPKKLKDINRRWSEEYRIDEKESHPHITKKNSNPINNTGKLNDVDDELKIESRLQYDNKKTICSPTMYSKFKRKSAKKKSYEQKQKLQALLTTDQTKVPKTEPLDDSTDYEGDEVKEDTNDLLVEGARSKTSSGMKRLCHKPATDNVKVYVCSRCAKIVVDSNLKRVQANGNLNTISDDENFESVSQFNHYKPVWSSVSNSETEEATYRISKLTNSPTKEVMKNNFNIKQIPAGDRSDFFETNDLIKNKLKNAGNYISDDESDLDGINPKVRMPTSKAWQQRLPDTGSEADMEEETQESEMKSYGWRQKSAFADDISDI